MMIMLGACTYERRHCLLRKTVQTLYEASTAAVHVTHTTWRLVPLWNSPVVDIDTRIMGKLDNIICGRHYNYKHAYILLSEAMVPICGAEHHPRMLYADYIRSQLVTICNRAGLAE